MSISESRDITAIFLDDRVIEDALNAAVRDAVQIHKEKGLPLATWRDGKVVWISAEEAEAALAASDKARSASGKG
jgi:hypothetical protein